MADTAAAPQTPVPGGYKLALALAWIVVVPMLIGFTTRIFWNTFIVPVVTVARPVGLVQATGLFYGCRLLFSKTLTDDSKTKSFDDQVEEAKEAVLRWGCFWLMGWVLSRWISQ